VARLAVKRHLRQTGESLSADVSLFRSPQGVIRAGIDASRRLCADEKGDGERINGGFNRPDGFVSAAPRW